MFRTIAVAALIAALGGAPAFAQMQTPAPAAPSDTVSGKIRTIDTNSMTVTLEDGKMYHFADAAALAKWKVGQKIEFRISH